MLTPTPIATGFPFQQGDGVRQELPQLADRGVQLELQPAGLSKPRVFADFTINKGVYLTRFTNPNVGLTAVLPAAQGNKAEVLGVPIAELRVGGQELAYHTRV